MSRFDNVQYDEQAIREHAEAKKLFEQIDHFIETSLKNGRAKSLTLTLLEEAFMWIGKAIRDEQILRNEATELNEVRAQ